MNRFLPSFFLFVLLTGALPAAEETAPSSCGKSFVISGEMDHLKTPGLKIEGADDDATYGEQVYARTLTATVQGLPADTYKVEVDLAETWVKGPGQRVMRITSGGRLLADNVDIYKAAGGFARAYKLHFQVPHEADEVNGPLSLTFNGLVQNATFNAIHIYDSKGGVVACVKACDLVDTATADPRASRIPTVSGPVIFIDPDEPMNARIDDLIRRMSLVEKALQMCNQAPAIPRLGVPAYNYWNECDHGVARAGRATVFPQAIGMAAAWDENLIHQVAGTIATEARAKYYQTPPSQTPRVSSGLNFWAPNINIFRDPRWGRGQETFGEDPYLTSRTAVSFITGLQGTDPKYVKAMACAKHFAVHSGPEAGRSGRDVSPSLRDLYETYLPQFQAAVQEGHVGQVMASYNALYGVPNACNDWLLTDILRKSWGYTGEIVSDCGAVSGIVNGHQYVKSYAEASALAVKAGLDMECGSAFHALPEAVEHGLVTEKEMDAALRKDLAIRFRLGLFDPPGRVPFSNIRPSEIESASHLELAREMARESMVLLKNDGILPLDTTRLKRIAVIGPNADDAVMLHGNYNGDATHPITILNGIRDAVGSTVRVDFVKGCPAALARGESEDAAGFQRAVAAAKTADLVIFVSGINASLESEESRLDEPGFFQGDRTAIELPGVQEHLLEAISATGKPVVLVNCSGSAMAIPWAAEHIPAILQAWYPGAEGGAAVADVLFGKFNPAGRLPVTFYEKTADLPAFTDYRMENRTYRYFKGKVLYPFGFGLSYTTFEYQPLRAASPRGGQVHLTVPVRNSGKVDGDEVVQVYLRHLDSPVPQPIRSLVAYKRLHMAKGEKVDVSFDIPLERFRYWSIAKQTYVVDAGAYELQAGASSSDIRQTARITIPEGAAD